MKCKVGIDNELSDEFFVTGGIKKRQVLAPTLLDLYLPVAIVKGYV